MKKIIGHSSAIKELEADLSGGRIAHGYLFIGTPGLGKFTIAKWFAEQLNGANPIDTIEIPDDGQSIKIEQIREIIARLNMTPQSEYKILMLKNINRMGIAAANCLLKTLEEPPPQTIFIFSAESLRQVLPTISSRMRVIQFRRITDEELHLELSERYPNYDKKILDSVVTLALGRPTRAISLMENSDTLNEMLQLYTEAETLLERRSPALSFLTADVFTKKDADPKHLKRFMEILLLISRKRLLETKDPAKKQGYTAFIERILKTQELQEKNVNSKLLLENLLLNVV